jgi:hypothetical protein
MGLPALLLAGCGGAPPPVDQLATTQAAIRAAQEAGAAEDPQGKLHLKLAQEQVDKGKAFMDDDENERAALLLQRAEADAQLAHALAKKRASAEKAVEAVEDVQKLQKDR